MTLLLRCYILFGRGEIEFLRAAEHLAADVPQFRVHRIFEQLVGGLFQVSEPTRSPGTGIAPDDPRYRRKMHKTPLAERIFEIDELLAELVEFGRAHAISVDVAPGSKHSDVLFVLDRIVTRPRIGDPETS